MANGHKTGGRKPGSKNTVTSEMRAAIEYAFKGMGGRKALLEWGEENPTLFWTKIFTLIVPKAVEVTGQNGGSIDLAVTVIEVAQSEPSTHDDDSPTPERQSLNGTAAH